MKRTHLRLLSVAVAILMLGSLLVGCGGSTTAGSTTTAAATTASQTTAAATQQQTTAAPTQQQLKGTLSAMIWLPDAPDIIQQQANDFMQKNPGVTIDLQMMTGNGIAENIQPKIASNSLPDFFSNNNDELGNKMADQGLLADVSDTKCFDNMLDSMKAAWTSNKNGVKYGISGGIATTMMFYNTDMFKKAGITDMPKDFDEFLTVCDKLKKAGFTPLVWYGGFPNMLSNGPFSYGIANNIAAKDPDFLKKMFDGTINLNTPEVADIYSKIKLIADKGYANKGFMSTDYNGGMQLFTDGKAAMIFQGSWAAGILTSSKNFETGVFLPPWNAKGQDIIPVIGSETGWSVAANNNTQLSKAFLDYINGDGYAAYQNKRQSVPPFKQPVGTVVMNDKVKSLVDEMNKAPVSCQLAFQVMPSSLLDLTFKQMQQVLQGAKTPEQAAAELDKADKDYAASNK